MQARGGHPGRGSGSQRRPPPLPAVSVPSTAKQTCAARWARPLEALSIAARLWRQSGSGLGLRLAWCGSSPSGKASATEGVWVKMAVSNRLKFQRVHFPGEFLIVSLVTKERRTGHCRNCAVFLLAGRVERPAPPKQYLVARGRPAPPWFPRVRTLEIWRRQREHAAVAFTGQRPAGTGLPTCGFCGDAGSAYRAMTTWSAGGRRPPSGLQGRRARARNPSRRPTMTRQVRFADGPAIQRPTVKRRQRPGRAARANDRSCGPPRPARPTPAAPRRTPACSSDTPTA